jgi:hypothetical protein
MKARKQGPNVEGASDSLVDIEMHEMEASGVVVFNQRDLWNPKRQLAREGTSTWQRRSRLKTQ